MTLMSPTTVVTTRDGARYEFTADRLHVRKAGSGWQRLKGPPTVEAGFKMLQVFIAGGFLVTGHVADIAYA